MWFIIILGIILYLLMDHPVAFWLVFVPLAILLVLSLCNFFKGKKAVESFVTVWIVVIAMIVALLVVVSNDQCEHEDMVEMYHFAAYDSTAYSDVRPYCGDCGTRFEYQLFKGTLVDQSYLSAIVEHSDGSEIVPGEYYTVTATVPMGFYATNGLWLNCKVENEDFVITFNVEFRDEFGRAVSRVEEGEEITFRGRFYDEGCGFTDCELISEVG